MERVGRLEQVLGKLERALPVPNRLRALRGTMVLERIGTREARLLLGILAEASPEAHLSQDASASQRRLAKRDP